MTLKRFLAVLLIVAGCFIAGVLVGRFVMPRQIQITVIDIRELTNVIERYNREKQSIMDELEKIKEWNENAIIELESEKENNENNEIEN